jgi:CheY-like chemotaxis protein
VHRFVRESGGAIRIDSTVGQGTTIIVLLPVAPEDAPEDVDAIDEAPHGVADRPLVLLVEDNAEVRRVIRMQLNRLGHPVVEAENGPQAVGMLEQIEGIGVVLTDLLMPGGMSGRDVAAKAGDLRPGIPVIMMSGHAQDAAARGPALRVLQKPIDAVSLRRALVEVLAAGAMPGKPVA